MSAVNNIVARGGERSEATVYEQIVTDLFAHSDDEIEPPPPAFGDLVECSRCGREYVYGEEYHNCSETWPHEPDEDRE